MSGTYIMEKGYKILHWHIAIGDGKVIIFVYASFHLSSFSVLEKHCNWLRPFNFGFLNTIPLLKDHICF
jgi:hypothetical protein